MVKIYNIHSNTISKDDLVELSKSLESGKDVYLLNEDFRYEIIDFDKLQITKSKNYVKNIYAFYIKIKNTFKKRNVLKGGKKDE